MLFLVKTEITEIIYVIIVVIKVFVLECVTCIAGIALNILKPLNIAKSFKTVVCLEIRHDCEYFAGAYNIFR